MAEVDIARLLEFVALVELLQELSIMTLLDEQSG